MESWWARARADGQTVDIRNGTLRLGILGWACATVDVFLCACVRRGRDAFVRASECGRSVRASESGASVRASEPDASARSTVNEHASAEETSENALWGCFGPFSAISGPISKLFICGWAEILRGIC